MNFCTHKILTGIALCFFSMQGICKPGNGSANIDTAAQRMSKDLSSISDSLQKANKYLDVAKFFVDKPGEEKADLQMAQQYCSLGLKLGLQRNDPQVIGKAYFTQAQIFREKGDQGKGRKFADQAVSLVNKINNPAILAGIYLEKSIYYSLQADSNIFQKIKYYRLGVSNLRLAYPNTLKLADALNYLGDLYNISPGGNAAALNILYEALAIYRANHYEKLQAVYNLIGTTLAMIERPGEGLKYSLLAVRTAERLKDSSMTTCEIYNRLAYTYNNLKDNKNAAVAMEKAVMFAKHNHQDMTAYILTANLAVAYIDLGDFQKALKIAKDALATAPKNQKIKIVLTIDLIRVYTAMGNYQQAGLLYAQVENLIAGTEQPNIIWDLMYSAGINVYMKQHNYVKVNKLISIYQGITSKVQNLMSMGKAEEFAYKADSAQGNFRGAFNHFHLFKKLSDSLNTRNHNKATAELQLQYETEKKDEDIASKAKNIQLLTSQTELQQRSLKNEGIIRNLSIVAVAMLLVLLAVIYNRYKIKREANYELEEQKEEINTQNESLKQLVTEREWLLKEVHHRVKNNLQIVISLLNSQSAYVDNLSARDVIRESKNRVNSISLIHQKLYQTDDLAGVDMYNYVHELVNYISDSFGNDNKIHFVFAVERITLDVSQAVPLGLIINEALTNAVKYAFLPGQDAKVHIKLSQSESIVNLEIADNGKGLPEGFDTVKLTSLGMNLMRGLSGQLGGQLEMHSDNGLYLSMQFKINRLLGFSPPPRRKMGQ